MPTVRLPVPLAVAREAVCTSLKVNYRNGYEWVRPLAAARNRLYERLEAVGWAGAQGDKLRHLKSCPPFVAVPGDFVVRRPCNRPLLCPFCHARRVVVPAARRFADQLARGLAQREEVWLTAFESAPWTFTAANSQWRNEDWRRARVRLKAWMQGWRAYEADTHRAALAFVRFRVELHPDEPELGVRRCGLVLSRSPPPDKSWRPRGVSYEYYRATRKPNANSLLESAVPAFGFPAANLRAQALDVLCLLDALSGWRLTTCYDRGGL